jgi:hypothetical protein
MLSPRTVDVVTGHRTERCTGASGKVKLPGGGVRTCASPATCARMSAPATVRIADRHAAAARGVPLTVSESEPADSSLDQMVIRANNSQ